jgi:hypothetical protein
LVESVRNMLFQVIFVKVEGCHAVTVRARHREELVEEAHPDKYLTLISPRTYM